MVWGRNSKLYSKVEECFMWERSLTQSFLHLLRKPRFSFSLSFIFTIFLHLVTYTCQNVSASLSWCLIFSKHFWIPFPRVASVVAFLLFEIMITSSPTSPSALQTHWYTAELTKSNSRHTKMGRRRPVRSQWYSILFTNSVSGLLGILTWSFTLSVMSLTDFGIGQH